MTAAGGVVVQWPGGVCIEAAVCSQLDEVGLNAYIAAALEVADDAAGGAVGLPRPSAQVRRGRGPRP